MENLAFTPALAIVKPWTFVTSVFLHAGFYHFFFNMIALFFFGLYLERLVGPRTFLEVFIIGGVIGNLGYLATAIIGLPSAGMWIPAVGASGAVYSIMATLAILRPTLIVYMYGFLPLPISVAMVLWSLFDVIGLFVPSGVASGAHIAGLLAGIYFGSKIRSSWRRLEYRYWY